MLLLDLFSPKVTVIISLLFWRSLNGYQSRRGASSGWALSFLNVLMVLLPRISPHSSNLSVLNLNASDLRSATAQQLRVPRVRRTTLGGRCFYATAVKLWNRLPSFLTSTKNLNCFKHGLKIFLLQESFEWFFLTFTVLLLISVYNSLEANRWHTLFLSINSLN